MLTAATPALDQAVSIFASLRPRLVGIAYRILGNSAEAEDIVVHQSFGLSIQAVHGADRACEQLRSAVEPVGRIGRTPSQSMEIESPVGPYCGVSPRLPAKLELLEAVTGPT